MPDRLLGDALRSWLPDVRPAGLEGGPAIEVSLIRGAEVTDQPRELIAGHPSLRYWRDASGIEVTTSGASGRLGLTSGRIQVWCDAPRPEVAEEAVRRCLLPLLCLASARHGLHAVHAAAVGVEGEAVLVMGPTNAGKSTLVGRMADLGASFMSDDTSYIDEDTKGVVGLRDRNRPRAPGQPHPGLPAGRLKMSKGADPRLLPLRQILALTRGRQAGPTIRPMPPEDLMAWLMRSGLFGLDPQTDPARLRVLAAVASATPAALITLGEQPPSDSLVMAWMAGGYRA